MLPVEPGHIYELDWIDGAPLARATGGDGTSPDGMMTESRLIFVRRDSKRGGHNHGGTQCQDVLRVLIDRVQYCDAQLPWPGNDKIIGNLRSALTLFEARALMRKTESGLILPEQIKTGDDGHFQIEVREDAHSH